ncbi:hypothetical protein [Nocardia asiatica]|uniref:hypothetical protein n=1 Tax=Nocardia asiatica TaxID=209252 RepID=UPI0003154B41|nr:hypothetical protein [Nocardia asiatica]
METGLRPILRRGHPSGTSRPRLLPRPLPRRPRPRRRLLRDSGRLPADLDPDRFAVIAVALLDGPQTQWLYDPAVDMAEHVVYLWELIERRGEGSERSRPPR